MIILLRGTTYPAVFSPGEAEVFLNLCHSLPDGYLSNIPYLQSQLLCVHTVRALTYDSSDW